MDLGSLPPEINSTRIYAGPGSGPMLAASAAWDGLAAELIATASGYQTVTSQLTSGPWLGAAAVSMLGAAGLYVGWLHATATQAEQTATQARLAAGAYEAARAASVPPPLVAANRAQLMLLVATNFLGQNTPAIAATEALYGEMWAQDATAMYVYAASSAAAAEVTPFAPPPATTNAAGWAGQAAAVARAAGGSAGIRAQDILASGQQLMSKLPRALQGLASPRGASRMSGQLSDLDSLTGKADDAMSTATGAISDALGVLSGGSSVDTASDAGVQAFGVAALPSVAPSVAGQGLAAVTPSGVAAGMGRASSLGSLSVPPSWASSVPSSTPAGVALAGADAAGAPLGAPVGTPLMPVPGVAGRGAASADSARLTLRPSVIPRPLVG
jgi:PPE-repeat protein